MATWSGTAYAFVTDVFSRRIVGWSVCSTMSTEALPLPAPTVAFADQAGLGEDRKNNLGSSND